MEISIFIIAGIVLLFIAFKIVKAFFKWALFLVVIAVVAYATNPSEETHRESLKDLTKTERLKRVTNKHVSVADYKIFSLTKVEVQENQYTVGFGAFGKIWYILGIPSELRR